jgi:crotonobetainyl-CoA:carnitine CoA-transferase CaiB-like acyl-CoA transferase
MGNRHPAVAPYETFATADRDIVVACGNDALYARLCAVIGRPDLLADTRFTTNDDRVESCAALAAELAPSFVTAPAEQWVERLNAAGVPAGPVNDVSEAYAFAEALGLDPVTERDGVRTLRSPLRLSDTPPRMERRPPALGEHDAELREWLKAPPPSPGGSSSAA